jgi:histone chaperone ASF1
LAKTKKAEPGEDSEMGGVETGKDNDDDHEEDEMSEDGSVDLEGESSDELEEEDDGEGHEGADDDAMEVDAADKAGAGSSTAPTPAAKPVSVAS